MQKLMSRFQSLPILGLVLLVAAGSSSSVRAQSQYIGFVYPAGGQQNTTFPIRLGGQGLIYASDVVVSGEGVSARLVDYYQVMSNEELTLLREQLNELRKKEIELLKKEGASKSGAKQEPGTNGDRKSVV